MKIEAIFNNGQCFNFAYSACEIIRKNKRFSRLSLVAAVTFRGSGEGIEEVCIHCMSKAYDLKKKRFIYLDAQGLHAFEYLDNIVETWQVIELEINGYFEEVNIQEYSFSDNFEVELYWSDLAKTGAELEPDILVRARQYILSNVDIFKDICAP